MNDEQLENPVFGYVVISVALVVGLLSATVFAQSPLPESDRETNFRNRLVAVKAGQESAERIGQKHPVAADSRRNFPSPRRWILGIRSTSTSAGCVITAVIKGSAAEKAGLTVGDRVITVDGKQVGWIGRHLAALHRAVDAAPAGKTRLLVQKSAAGNFQSVSIRLRTVEESLGN